MVAVGNLHNTRILRFFLVLIVVILTIFIYASYSTTTTLTPTHMHPMSAGAPPTPQPLVLQQMPAMIVLNNTGEFGLAPSLELQVSSSANSKVKQLEPQHKKQHRLPTIDEDALLDGGAAGASPIAAGSEQSVNLADDPEEQQYVQSFDAITGNINNNNNNESVAVKQAAIAAGQQQQQQSPSDAENLMIPTSNLQKFIENADKILKNMTSNSSTVVAGTGAGTGAGVGTGAAVVSLPSEQRTSWLSIYGRGMG